MANILMVQTSKGLPVVRAKVKMRQSVKKAPKAKLPIKKTNEQDKA